MRRQTECAWCLKVPIQAPVDALQPIIGVAEDELGTSRSATKLRGRIDRPVELLP